MDIIVDRIVSSSSAIVDGAKKEEEEESVVTKKEEEEEVVDDYADWTKGNWCYLLPATTNNGTITTTKVTHSAAVVKMEKGRRKNDKATIPPLVVSRSMKRAPAERCRDSHGKRQKRYKGVSSEKDLLSDNNNNDDDDDDDDENDELPKKEKKRKLKYCRSQQQYNSSSIHSNNLPSSSYNSIQDNETKMDDNKNEIKNAHVDTIIKQEEDVKTKEEEEEEDNSDSKINTADNDDNDNDADTDSNADADGYESWTVGNWCLLLPSTTTTTTTSLTDDERKEDEPPSEEASLTEITTTQRRRRGGESSSVSSGVSGDDTDDNEYDDEDYVDDDDDDNNDNDDDTIDKRTKIAGKSTVKHKNNVYNKQWHVMFRRLVAHRKKYGSANVRRTYKDDPKLATWVNSQRTSYRKKGLSEERINRLESIGFVWKDREAWDQMFRKLVSYKKKHNSTIAPIRYVRDPKLGNWVSRQRTFYSNKTIPIDRINRLESIGFVWDPCGEKWIEFFYKLVAYKKQHKSTNVPNRYAEDPKLGSWVSSQRTFYNNKTISIDRINRLESIGFVWDPLDTRWMEMYQKLMGYKKQYKSTKVPQQYIEDPQLGLWSHTQRASYRNNKLSDKRTELLNSINFVWSECKASI
jgi:hypothetical protein